MSAYEGGVESTDAGMDLWRVQLATGELRAMSLDALDDAFQAGVITESTPVLPPGATAWTKLADAAGLESDAPSPESTAYSVAPIAVSLRSEPPSSMAPYEQQLALESLPDLEDLDDNAFKAKKSRLFAGIGIAVVLVGGLGYGASRLAKISGSPLSSLSAPAAAAEPPRRTAITAEEQDAKLRALTEEQRIKLAAADKAREEREAAKRAARPPPPPKRGGPRAKSADPVVNGGNKFDPLNGAL